MSWKYQLNDPRATQAQVASGLRAASRAAKFSARRGTGGGFGNLSMAAVGSRNAARSIPIHAGGQRFNFVGGVGLVPAYGRSMAPENKTFDVGGTAPIVMLATTDTAVANAAGGYLLDTAASASAVVLNQVPLGNSSTTRIGRKLAMKALHIRFKVEASSAAAAAADVQTAVFVALVLIRKNDRVTTALPPQNTVFCSQNMLTLTNIDNADRFKILRKWDCWPVGDKDLAGDRTASSAFIFDEYVKLKGIQTVWTQGDTTGTFDNMEEGALCLYVRGSSAAATSTNAVRFVSRLYYSDQ